MRAAPPHVVGWLIVLLVETNTVSTTAAEANRRKAKTLLDTSTPGVTIQSGISLSFMLGRLSRVGRGGKAPRRAGEVGSRC